MKRSLIKKKDIIKVEINGSDVPHYIDRIIDSLSEIAVTGTYGRRRQLGLAQRYKK